MGLWALQLAFLHSFLRQHLEASFLVLGLLLAVLVL
jgi:hypothetical protein